MIEAPSGWRSVRLDEVTEINPRKPAVTDLNMLVTFLAMEDVSEEAQVIGGSEQRYADISTGYTFFAERDVLVAKITPCFENGKGAQPQKLTNGIGFGSTEFHVLRPGVAISDRFLYYLTTSSEFRRRGEINMQGSAGQKRVPTNFLRSYRFFLPPLPEQRKIAQILRAWDEAIAAVEQLVSALQRRKKGLIQRLLTGQVRFPEFVVSRQTQATRYGAIPVDWEYEPIGEIAVEISVKNRGNGPLPVLSCTKYEGLVDSLEYFGRQIFSQDTSTYKVVKRGQFAYATNHIEEGSIGYQDLHDEALISPMYTVFQANERAEDAFLYRLLKTELYRHIFEVNTSGTVNRRGRLGWDDFARIKVPLPGLPEQRRIAEFFYVVDQEIELAKKQVEALKTQKKGLMQRLLTGQVRVQV